MIYGSVCSGIEAATVAWHSLGWEPAWFSEIEKFPNAVLKHHYPNVPNLGSMIGLYDHPKISTLPTIDLLVGGTPCQSFSIAGLRGGLQDGRDNLALEYCRLARALQPKWVVWENVPGVLSSNRGRDFGSILGALVECGYGISYRVLNAKHFGVPQRRRRVFVVGYLGDWRPAAAVLFEPESLCGYTEPNQEDEEEDSNSSEISIEECSPISISGDVTPKIGVEISPTLRSGRQGYLYDGCHIRRFTPLECERLQGFPDNYTNIPGASDTKRYKALGNSMAVPVMRWIGERIQEVSK